MTLAAIVLAAGAARRFGGDKLAADFHGEPLLWHAIRAARAAPVAEVVVVASGALVLPRGDGASVRTVCVASDGLSTSLKAGIAALDDASDGAFVFLGDMPLVPWDVAHALAALIRGRFAAVPRCEGQSGHPVLFSRRAMSELAALTGDAGAGQLLHAHDDVVWLDTHDRGILIDVDRREDLARLGARRSTMHSTVVVSNVTVAPAEAEAHCAIDDRDGTFDAEIASGPLPSQG